MLPVVANHCRSYHARHTANFHPVRQSTPRSTTIRLFLSSVGLSSAAGVLVTSGKDEVVWTHRKRFVLVSPQIELTMGRMLFKAEKGKVDASDPRARMLTKVGKKLSVAAAALGAPLAEPEFAVVKREAMNAYCAPAGKMAAYTGMFAALEKLVDKGKIPSVEAGLMAVMAHETGHAIARHSAEKLSVMTVPMSLVYMLRSSSPLLSSLVDFLVTLPFSRNMELEADELGVVLMVLLGQDPRVAVTVMGSLPTSAVEWTSTHPTSPKRARRLQEIIATFGPDAVTQRGTVECLAKRERRRRTGQV